MNHFHFNLEKTIQAAGVLLRESKVQSMSRMRLLKFLYIADRRMLERHGRLITGSQPVAMKYGPVLDDVYGLIKGEESGLVEWRKCFQSLGTYVLMTSDPGIKKLSRIEVHLLQEVVREYENIDSFDISEETHMYSEWVKNRPDGTRNNIPISIDDMIHAVGRSEELSEIKDEIEYYHEVNRLNSEHG